MSRNPFFDQWLKFDATKAVPGLGSVPVDMSSFMESGRKTLQAITEAQQLTLENMQVIAERQKEIISQFVADQSALLKDIADEGTPEEKIARGADLMRKNYEKTIANSREITDLLQNSTREATDIINNRIATSLRELKTTVEESPVKTKKGKVA